MALIMEILPTEYVGYPYIMKVDRETSFMSQ